MANKVIYNNISYDVLDAITISNRKYLILVDSTNVNNITYLESSIINGEAKYALPPKSFDVTNNPNYDLKRLQVNFVVTTLIDMLRVDGTIRNMQDLSERLKEMKSFILTDSKIQQMLDENVTLDQAGFIKMNDYLEKYLNENLLGNVKEEYTYLNRPIQTKEGLDYEWLYDLNLQQLKELASGKERTSSELIYILDALNKRETADKALENYTEMGRALTLTKNDNKAAFIDILLISLITASFSLLLLIGLF